MKRSASFSEDRSRRFDLVRDWRDEIGAPSMTVLFVALNPSQAGEVFDDPSVRKTVGFARRWGYGRVVLVNLNPIVATDPWDLPPWNGIDGQNRVYIAHWVREAHTVVAAWGNQPVGVCRTIALSELIHDFRQMSPLSLYCIGLTKRGDPLHPSRARYTERPALWREWAEGLDP